MSEYPLLTSTTAKVAAPSLGLTSFLTGVVATEEEAADDEELPPVASRSIQYASRNTGPPRFASMICLSVGTCWAFTLPKAVKIERMSTATVKPDNNMFTFLELREVFSEDPLILILDLRPPFQLLRRGSKWPGRWCRPALGCASP